MRNKLTLWALCLGTGVAGATWAQPKDLYQGDGFGSHVFMGSTVVAGKTAPVGLGCVTEPGTHAENTVATFDLAPIVTTGGVNTTADALEESGVITSLVTAEVHDVELLDPGALLPPMISATQVRSVSATSFDGATFSVDGDESHFIDLQVLGLPVIDPPPNTEIDLPGVGRVVLNEQVGQVLSNRASLDVNMIHVHVEVLGNVFGLEPGTEIIVSHARSSLKPSSAAALLGGGAYVTQATVGEIALLGPTARVGLGCTGGNRMSNIAGVSLPPLLDLGEGVTTAVGSVGAHTAVGDTSATVQSVDLLDGLITADAVVAMAHGESNGIVERLDDDGSGFVNLVVDGQALIDVDPNTQIPLAGIGTLWLHRVITTPNGIEVRMIELSIEESGLPGIDAGTTVLVAVASVRLR